MNPAAEMERDNEALRERQTRLSHLRIPDLLGHLRSQGLPDLRVTLPVGPVGFLQAGEGAWPGG